MPTPLVPAALGQQEEVVTALARLRPRAPLTRVSVAAPTRLAPVAAAVGLCWDRDGVDVSSGRLVVLHDPDGQPSWAGRTRLIGFVQAEVEPELATDPVAAGVVWSWLEEHLAEVGVVLGLAGTVTVTRSETFGSLAGASRSAEPSRSEVQLRCSWSPTDDVPLRHLAAHAQAWADLLATASGLPPPA